MNQSMASFAFTSCHTAREPERARVRKLPGGRLSVHSTAPAASSSIQQVVKIPISSPIEPESGMEAALAASEAS